MQPDKELTIENRILSINRMIRQQFPKCGDGQLCFGIVEKAIKDVCNPLNKRKTDTEEEKRKMAEDEREKGAAQRFLLREIVYAEICEVQSWWIRSIIRRGGFNLDTMQWSNIVQFSANGG